MPRLQWEADRRLCVDRIDTLSINSELAVTNQERADMAVLIGLPRGRLQLPEQYPGDEGSPLDHLKYDVYRKTVL